MPNPIRIAVLCLIVLVMSSAVLATGQVVTAITPRPVQNFGNDNSGEVIASVAAGSTSIRPGGRITVLVHLEIADGWHVYWRNPEGPGEPIAINWDLPEGVTAGPIQWPAPHVFDFIGIKQFGYEHEVDLLVELTAADSVANDTTLAIRGNVSWLACEESCIPGDMDFTLSLPVSDRDPQPTEAADRIEAARPTIPRQLDAWTASAEPTEGGFRLRIEGPGARRVVDAGPLYFFSDTKHVVDPTAPQEATADGDAIELSLRLATEGAFGEEINREGPVSRLRGVLVAAAPFDEEGRYKAIEIDAALGQAGGAAVPGGSGEEGSAAETPAVVAASPEIGLGLAVALAFVGGLILNLMPCVFPVLSIKILGFVQQSGENRAIVRRHGYFFGVGVLVSFWLLAGLLLALRGVAAKDGDAGSYAWGFQMQNPVFVLGMILLVFGIGLNLIGAFEVGLGMTGVAGKMNTRNDGYSKSFLSGVLATLIATPCSAPFMAGALGAALIMPAWQAMIVFTALGIGMATPYVLLSCLPFLLNYLPRPGAWMESFKQAMAFPMFATAGWLAWVYVGLTDDGMVVRLLIGLTIVALGAWVYGRWSTPVRTPKVRWIGRATALAFVIAGVAMIHLYTVKIEREERLAREARDAGAYVVEWVPYSEAALARLQSEGRPVLIDFTARWCVTCQANKKSTLRTSTAEQLYREHNVALIEADFTKKEPEMGAVIDRIRPGSVPLYVVYPADGSGDYEILPNILTPQILEAAINRAAEKNATASR